MKNQMLNVLKISGFAVVVASTASAAFGQAQPRVAAPRPTVTVDAPQLTTVQGKAVQVTARNAVNAYAVKANLGAKDSAALYRKISVELAAKERAGQKLTVEVARTVFMENIASSVAKQANAAALNEMASVAFADAMNNTSSADLAKDVVENQVAKVTGEQAAVKCDLVDSTRSGLAGADGIMSRDDADLATVQTMEGLHTVILKNAKVIGNFYASWPTNKIETFATPNGKPVAFTVTGPVETADKWFAGSKKDPSSIDVAEGFVGVQQVMIDVKTGIGKSADQTTLWALSMGELTTRLTPMVGADQAATIVYGQLYDANNPSATVKDLNGDGQVDEQDGYVRGELSADGKTVVASGISGKCAVNFGIKK